MNGKKLRYGLVFFVLTTLIYMLMELRYGLPIRALRPKHYAAAAVLAVYSCLIHSRRAGASSGYARELFLGYQNKPGRIVYMDYLRVLAALLVILVHVLEPAYALLPPHTFTRNVMAASAGLGLSCNLLFMMLSGALLLGGKEESVLEFYSRRFVRVLIPCFAYYLFYFFYVEGISALSPGNWGSLLQSFLSNDSGQTPHFWLVYIILMFYVAAPFFRIMLKHMTEPMLEALTAVIIILHFIYTYGPLVRVEFAASAFLAFHFPAGILLHHPVCHETLPAVHDSRPAVRAGNSGCHHGLGEPGPIGLQQRASPDALYLRRVSLLPKAWGLSVCKDSHPAFRHRQVQLLHSPGSLAGAAPDRG